MELTSQQAAQELLNRRHARTSFLSWCKMCGYEPATHHLMIIDELQKAVDNYKSGKATNLMLLLPPGSAKSTYTSKLFPAWFLAQLSNLAVLACSHSAELANDFGRAGRNLVDAHAKILGYELTKDSRAADSWEVTNGGYYRAAGCGAGISGRRADLCLIDDFLGKESDAASKLFNDGIFNWWQNDVIPRLKPNAIRIIICNHRNEDDLVGRLLAKEASKWRVVRLRLFIENEEQSEQDPLNRKVGEWLWPTYFTKEMVEERMANPSSSGIEQQEPSPQAGAFFEKDKLSGYLPKELPSKNECCVYGASDHAVRIKQKNDNTCMGVGMFQNGFLYIHPDLVWDKIQTNRAVKEMLRFSSEYNPLYWWAEKENISGAIGPFLRDQMEETQNFMTVQEVSHKNKDKMAMAQSAHALAMAGLIRFPKYATWWGRAERELLLFPNGLDDDFVTFLSLLGKGIKHMTSPNTKKQEAEKFNPNQLGFNITSRSIREQGKKDKRQLAFLDR